jgi:hypothetical protein
MPVATLNSTPFQSTKNNAVILSPFYARYQRQATAKIPAGHKKGEGSSQAFTSYKKPCASNDRLLLGIPSPKNNAVILSPFYARYQRQATATIPAGHKKGEGSSRAFTPSKKPCESNNRLRLGILPKKTLSS